MAKSLKKVIAVNCCSQSADYQCSNQLENFMKNPHKGVHKSYGVHWTDILELNDAEEMAKRSAILVGLSVSDSWAPLAGCYSNSKCPSC